MFWVLFAGVPTNAAIAHEITAVEGQVLATALGHAELRGLEPLVRQLHALGYLPWQRLGVVRDEPPRPREAGSGLPRVGEFRSRVGVSGADHDAARLDAGGLLNGRSGLIGDSALDANEVQHDQRGALAAGLDDQCLAVKRVEHAIGAALVVIARHRNAHRWSDVNHAHTDADFGGRALR